MALKNIAGLGLGSHLSDRGSRESLGTEISLWYLPRWGLRRRNAFESRVLEKSKLSPVLGTNICGSVWQPLVPKLICTGETLLQGCLFCALLFISVICNHRNCSQMCLLGHLEKRGSELD